MVDRLANQFDWEVQNRIDFERKLDELAKHISDFTIPFRLISSDFYRSQRQLFTLQGAGKFIDLSENYKPVKQKKVGFTYPILLGKTRVLANSTLGPKNLYSIWTLRKTELLIGSRVPYGKYHQSDKPRKVLPQRKFIFITGGDGDRSKDSGIYGRRERWLAIIDTHIKQLVSGEV